MRKGFTLVEILVAISILGVLSAIGFIDYSQAQSIARDDRRKQDLATIKAALDLYYQQNKTYPITGLNHPGTYYTAFSDQSYWNTLSGLLVPGFISQLPNDPKSPNYGNCCGQSWYVYGYTTNGSAYALCANLENNNDTGRNNPSLQCPNDSNTSASWADYVVKSTQ